MIQSLGSFDPDFVSEVSFGQEIPGLFKEVVADKREAEEHYGQKAVSLCRLFNLCSIGNSASCAKSYDIHLWCLLGPQIFSCSSVSF